jgi:hypothetical protein
MFPKVGERGLIKVITGRARRGAKVAIGVVSLGVENRIWLEVWDKIGNRIDVPLFAKLWAQVEKDIKRCKHE